MGQNNSNSWVSYFVEPIMDHLKKKKIIIIRGVNDIIEFKISMNYVILVQKIAGLANLF